MNVATQAIRTEALSFLVAEDNAVNQMIIVAMIRQLGHTVTVAANGREALEALAREHFDVVLMDCNMPELDGLEATRQLRAGVAGVRDAHVTVIALTANAMDGDREACLAAGMDDFLSKPVSIQGAAPGHRPGPFARKPQAGVASRELRILQRRLWNAGFPARASLSTQSTVNVGL